MEYVCHTLKPIYDECSRVLILGTMPSPKSRETGMYYGNPQNRFWRALSVAIGDAAPTTPEARREWLLQHHIALWDVLESCEIMGASDNSIRAEKANDISLILCTAPVVCVFTTGKTASRLYRKHCIASTGIEDICLPSPSAANCRLPFDELVKAYGIIREQLHGFLE